MMVSRVAQAEPSKVFDEEAAVHEWRVSQLTRLGLAADAAEAVPDTTDWHEVARLVRLGCPASLAVAIIA
jgi:hypothetical protein